MLSLFVSGNSPTSLRARSNLANLQANGLPSHWDVEVVDVLKNPGRAEQAGILATPTLSVPHPSRPRRIVGDLGDAAKVLEFLGIGMGSEGT
jgi:circadian clock protein KaiB